MGTSILSRQQLSECVTDKLERPLLDNRIYKVIKLPNKLEALLIHDPDTDKASAALDVNAGAFSDDEDLPGMAHAVEHLLFMGTKKYPKENEYNQYLSAHSGYSNAFTASTSTNYFFEVAAKSSNDEQMDGTSVDSPLHGALDRFAQFFIAPLFLEETLDRELRAVDSENKKNLQSDVWRLMQLGKSLGNPAHPYCHFSTGNLSTLRDEPLAHGVKIRDEFMRFHYEQYSANRMKLVVLGREPVDKLQVWVEELFSDVQNKELPQNRWDGVMPYTEKQLRTQIFATPVMDSRTIEIMFPYQDEEDLYESQPGRYLSHLIGHEGPGSILAYIKSKGWANELSAGARDVCPGSALFIISVRLTPEGLKNYQEILKVIFSYVAIIRDAGPQQWIFQEVKEMTEVDFRFRQKAAAHRTTSNLSQVMQKPLPRDRLLSGSSVLRTFNADAIRRGIQYLNPDNFRITVVSQEPLPGERKKEKWYGTEYSTEDIPEPLLQKLRQVHQSKAEESIEGLHLPHKNEFIPSRLEVDRKDVTEPAKAPKIIRQDEHSRLWYKKDDQFWVPKANFFALLRSPICGLSPRSMVMAQLVSELVRDELTEFSYDAEIAGLDYDILSYSTGLGVTVSGYNDKMPVLLDKVVSTLQDLHIKNERFEIIKERTMRSFKNYEYSVPYGQISQYTRWLSTERGYITAEYLSELSGVTVEDVRQFHPQLLRQMHIEALAHGNLHREDALRMLDVIVDTLKPLPLHAAHWPIRRSLILPQGSDVYYSRRLKDPSNVNHCIQYLLSIGSVEDRALFARLQLFAQMTHEPAFDQLRTKEQLGYVVFSGSLSQLTSASYQVLIQSERAPKYLETRIENFLSGYEKDLRGMPLIEFERHKQSVISKRQERLKNLSQESNRHWGHITNEFYFFDEYEDDVEHLRALTQQDMVEFYSTYISPTSARRAKLSVQLTAGAGVEDGGKVLGEVDQKTALIEVVQQFLNARGIVADNSALSKTFDSVNLKGPGVANRILAAFSKYLSGMTLVEADRVHRLNTAFKALLSSALSALGISEESESESNDVKVAESKVTRAARIEHVHTFKAGLAVSRGARPVKDLSVYEDLGSKL